MFVIMHAMLVLRGPQGRLFLPTESPSLNKSHYLLTNYKVHEESIDPELSVVHTTKPLITCFLELTCRCLCLSCGGLIHGCVKHENGN